MAFRKVLQEIIAYSISLILPKVALNKRFFLLWEKKGFHIIPIHFYEPIPDTRTLKDELWESESDLAGLDMNTNEQLKLLHHVFHKFKEEFNFPKKRTQIPHEYYLDNGFFPSVDAEVLHGMIRHFKPKKIIEIGSGFSTYLSANACLLNIKKNEVKTELNVIDPFPNDILKKGFPGLSSLTQKPLEKTPLEFFLQLEENDILFIDSSHVVRIGGDVNYAFLEVLPRLKKGVIVHFHDIFLPLEYPKRFALEVNRFWSEQYLLQAFLSFNYAYEILWASHYMHHKYPKECKSVFPSYREDVGPASFWIRRKE